MSTSALNSAGISIPLESLLINEPNPIVPSNKLHTILPRYKETVTLTIEALSRFIKGDLSRFDAHVGECSCQIRACMLADYYRNSEVIHSLQKTLNCLYSVLEAVNKIEIEKSKKYHLSTFLKEQSAHIDIPVEAEMITYAYVLSAETPAEVEVYKDANKGLIDLKPKEVKKAAVSPLNEKKTKTKLAEHSVKYIQSLTSYVPDEIQAYLVDSYVRTTKASAKHLPAYAQIESVLNYTAHLEIPIVLKVRCIDPDSAKTVGIINKIFTHNKGVYSEVSPESLDVNSSVVVAEGFIPEADPTGTLTHVVNTYGVDTIIRCAVAAHPQYVGDYNFEGYGEKHARYLKLAHQVGFCKTNPSSCRVFHLYADTIKNAIHTSEV